MISTRLECAVCWDESKLFYKTNTALCEYVSACNIHGEYIKIHYAKGQNEQVSEDEYYLYVIMTE